MWKHGRKNPPVKIQVKVLKDKHKVKDKDVEYVLEQLDDTSTSLRSLLNKVKGLQQKGYEGRPYSEKVLLEEMGFKYTVATPTEEDIKRVIDDFI